MKLKTKIKNWESNVSLIGPTFGKMADQQQNDDTRPMIEYYRSQKELILYSPIKDVPKP
jgi:hypothetical protein